MVTGGVPALRYPSSALTLASFVALASSVACTTTTVTPVPSGGESPTDKPADTSPAAPASEGPDLDLAPDLVKARPYGSKAPAGDDGSTALPLVLALHGRGDTGPNFVRSMGLLDVVDSKKVLLAYPTGEAILGASGWAGMRGVKNAPDDEKYLRAVIADMKQRFNVDGKRVVVVGLSLGGFMANFFACSAADKITGILSISGSLVSEETSRCNPARPLSITLVHGTDDGTIAYEGGTLPLISKAYPGASGLYDFWSNKMGCSASTALPAADFDSSISGAETAGKTQTGCQGGGKVSFFTIKGGAHVPQLSATVLGGLIDDLAQPRD
jgi:polyhydroxybutyrate depolymerase